MRFLYDLNDTDILQTGIFGLMNQTDYSPSFKTICIYAKQVNFYNFTIKCTLFVQIFFSLFTPYMNVVLNNFSLSPAKQSMHYLCFNFDEFV